MSTLYVDNLQPNLGSQVEIPNLKPLAGSVVNVIQNTSGTGTQITTTNTWTDVNPTVTITPESASNKVLVSHHAPVMVYQTTHNQHFRLLRGSTELIQFGRFYTELPTGDWHSYTVAFQFLDAPNTTSAVTYKIQMIMTGGTNPQMRHNNLTSGFTPTCMTTAMEIAQ